ncbi:MAG: nucleoside deaminase, partial [Saprospiraceae bacterium]|nr:nucleoside deaminase [Saprospiraceae bacterium]
PCLMCAGALNWSQISKIVYGASDEKKGFMRYGKELLHPKTKLEFGIFHEECSEMVRNFFEKKRKKNTAY